MGKCKNKCNDDAHKIERFFDVPIEFDQELGATPDGFIPISLIPGIVNPNITGRLKLGFNKSFTRAEFKLFVFGANTNPNNFIRLAHLHFGRADVNGPVVVDLFIAPTPAGVAVNGLLAEGFITNANIHRNAPSVVSVTSLFDAVRRGQIYINVHTVVIPAGAIRGQIFAAETTA